MGLWGYFWGESGSTEQNMNPTLSLLILDGRFVEGVLIIFCSIFKVLCWSFLPCTHLTAFLVCVKFSVDPDNNWFVGVFLVGKWLY